MTKKIFKSNFEMKSLNLNHSILRVALLVLLTTLGITNAWANTGGSSNYYASLQINEASGKPTGAGSVYVSKSTTKPSANAGAVITSDATTSSGGSRTFYYWIDVNPGYNVKLSGDIEKAYGTITSGAQNTVNLNASTSADGTQAYTATATFVAVTVDKVNNSTSNVTTNLNPTDPSADYPFTVTFATSNLKTIPLDLNKSPETADGKFTITSWAEDGNNVVATGKFNGGGSYGGASRNHSTTVSLQSKASGSAAKTCTVTANFPALAFVGVEATEVFATQGESGKTGSATFTYNYGAEDDFPTTPTLTPVSGTGALAITGYTVTPNFSDGTCEVTVDYTYDTNNGVGDTEATLTLTAANGDAHSVTIAGHSEAAATDDAKVIAADGETLIYQGDWATAWTKANTASNAGCTLQVLRNVTGGSLNANQKVTNTFTLDLNGKILSANYNGSIIYLNTAGKTLTIKDSKTGGRIENVNNAYAGMAIIVNAEKGNLIFESGTLYCENKGASGRRAVVIYNQAGTTVTMNGGKLEAHGYNNSQGVLQTSNKNNNTSFTMNGGEIEVDGYQDIYGVSAPGKVNINDGTINVTATYSNCRGITLSAAANATAANCYWGTLTMKGGTINSTCTANADGTRYAYGIVLEGSYTASMGTGVATDGSHANKAASTGTIENATINVSTLGRYAYGVLANGSYQSKTNHYDVIQIKNTKIDVTSQYYYTYGVYANCGINGTNGGIYAANIELTNCDVTATTTKNHTAYAVWAVATATTIYKNVQPNYYGEYAGGATVTVNSGTYTANTGTTNAYAIGTSARAKSTYDSESNVTAERKLGGKAEGFATLNIHGGKFIANAGTTTARAVSNGGNCTIDGGEFYATAGSSTADGIYTVSGKLKASGVKIEASATGTVYGVRVDAANVPYNTDAAWTGFNYAGDAELNNLDVTVTARTGATAYGVYLNAVSYQYTQSAFDTYMQGRIDAGKVTQANADIWAAVFPGNSSYAIAGKAVINGGKYTVRAATTTAHGIYSVNRAVSNDKAATAATEMTVKNVKLDVKTNGTTTACGIRTAGPSTIDGADIKVNSQTTTCYGMIISDQEETTVTNTKIDASGTATVYGIFVNASAPSTTNGYDWHGKAILGDGNDVIAKATAGNESYAVFLQANKAAVASGEFAGDYANGGEATITGGKYTATATGTTAYGIFLKAQTQQGSVYGRPRCTVTGGKFWGKATGGTDGAVNGSGVQDYFVLKGGVYNVNTNLSKYIPEGYEEFPLPNDRPEYTEGYRYAIEPVGMHGNYVCQIGSTKYKTLEEALQAVTSGKVIYMIANYTMTTPGDYVLPSGATLLIPYKDGTGKGASTAIGNSAETTTSGTTPSLFRKLTFGNGVNLICSGTIETSAQQKANGQYGANVGMPSGAYGQIHMEEGSHISLEAGSRLNCWGYITGKGTINVKKNAAILEGFQMGDWCGGTNYGTLGDNSQKVFPVTHYFYQSIECPVTYRPGSRAYGSSHINVSYVGVVGQDNIALVGTSGSMFIMDDNDVSAETWVMKDYDEATDQCIWTINSGASLGNLTIEIYSYKMRSANYDLPITTNMSVVLNYGEMALGQNSVFLPGSKLIINKQGTAVLNGVTVTAYDAADWTGTTRYFATYSPTWGTTNPRKNIAVESAEIFLHGKLDIRSNGGLYTTPGGANIHSTNADAGEVIYTTAAQGNKTNYYLKQGTTTRTAVTTNPARLKNGDGSYAASAGTTAGKTWTYKNDVWDAWSKDGCFFMNAEDKPHAKPAELVELTGKTPDENHLHHDAATGTRNFVWDAACYWWEVVTTPTAEGYYKSLNADNNGDYNYYYYDGAANCWKIKKITVTWNVNGTNTNYSVGYGTKPEWLGATPTKSSSSSNYVWRWDGWTMGSDPTVLANNDLPYVTENTTFTAHFYEKYYEYNITFKNDDGTILESKNWIAGTTPSYEGTPTKNPTAAETYEFNGTWTPAIAVVSGSATYTANYTATPRAYTITFLNYDMSVLGTTEVVYNGTPTDDTYKAAIAPSDFEPYKPDNSAYSFEFSGWRLQGASENGFTQVKGDQIYVAQFTETTKKYLIAFVDDDGETMLHYVQLPYDADIVYDGPDPTTFAANKTNDEWCYTFTEWAPELKDKKVDGPQTYVATYKKRSNLVVDIADWSSSQVTLNTTNWALGGWPYTVNGTKYHKDKETATEAGSDKYRAKDRTLTIDYSGNPNEMLTIEVYNVNGELYSIHSYTIPYVFATSSTLSSVSTSTLPSVLTSSVIYVNGGSLTIDNETEVNAIYVASCAELIVNSPLTVSKLVLRTKETEAASLENNSTIEATNTYYTRQVSDMAYHQFALPLGVSSTDDVFLSSRAACPYGKTWLLKSYNESERAKNGMGAESNWQEVLDKSPIEASRGYEFYSGSAFYREFYFPVDLGSVSTEKKVAVGYTSNASAGEDNAGWNVLCSPLLGKFTQHFDPNNAEDGIKISQWIDGQYKQSAPSIIYPAVPFYYQAKESGKFLYFTGDKMVLYNSPRNAWNTSIPTQWLQLTIHNSYGDKMDETSIYTHPEKFSMIYESGCDVAKQSLTEGKALLYTELPYGKLAFAAVPDSIAEARIPLTAYVAAEGEYVFSMVESNYLGRLQYVFLHDTQTGLVTDLLERDYAVKLAQGTNAGRFYIQCVFAAEAPAVTTGVNSVESNDDAPQKIMYKNRVYIIYQGRVYDMTGRQCELK